MTHRRLLVLLAVGQIALPMPHARAQRSTPLDGVLVGGRVLDPETNLDGVRAVGIRGGRIVSVSAAVPAARDTVDVRGLVVAPGFIDLHSHGQDSINYRYLARDGVTTALELELGTYPVAPWYAKRESKSLINFGVSASHPGARRAMLDGDSTAEGADVIGATGAFVRSPIGRTRLSELELRLDAALDDGALGIGMGINYTPAATREEIMHAFGVAARHHAPVFVHLRSAGLLENAGGVAGVQEVLADAAATGAPLHVVHVTSMGLGATPVLLDLIDGARARGLDVTTEAYPYTAGATMLQSAIFDPGFQERLGIDYKDILWAATGERLTAESFERYRKQGGDFHDPRQRRRPGVSRSACDGGERWRIPVSEWSTDRPPAQRRDARAYPWPIRARARRDLADGRCAQDDALPGTPAGASRSGDEAQGTRAARRRRRPRGVRSGTGHRSRYVRAAGAVLGWDRSRVSERHLRGAWVDSCAGCGAGESGERTPSSGKLMAIWTEAKRTSGPPGLIPKSVMSVWSPGSTRR